MLITCGLRAQTKQRMFSLDILYNKPTFPAHSSSSSLWRYEVRTDYQTRPGSLKWLLHRHGRRRGCTLARMRACVWLKSPCPFSHVSCKNMQSSCSVTISAACISCHQLTQRNTEVPMLTDFTCSCASRCTPECVFLSACLCAPFRTNTLANVMQLSKAQPASPFSS